MKPSCLQMPTITNIRNRDNNETYTSTCYGTFDDELRIYKYQDDI
jgi:hypothetical protein